MVPKLFFAKVFNFKKCDLEYSGGNNIYNLNFKMVDIGSADEGISIYKDKDIYDKVFFIDKLFKFDISELVVVEDTCYNFILIDSFFGIKYIFY